MQKSELKRIDIAKFFFAICIVLLHTQFFTTFEIGQIIIPAILRLAVPFFFVASGFFVGEKIYYRTGIEGIYPSCSDEKKSERGGYCGRLLKMLLQFEVVNILLQIILLLVQRTPLKLIALLIVRSILFYPYGALWYLQAVLVALLILYPFLKRERLEAAMIMGAVLYIVALLGNRYYFMFEGTAFAQIINLYLKIFVSFRNGLFVGLLFVSEGILISKYGENLLYKRLGILTVVSYLLFLAELLLIKSKPGVDDNSLFIMLPIVVPAIFIWLLKLDHINPLSQNTKTLRNLSTSIYLLHYPVLTSIQIVYLLQTGRNINKLLLTGMVCFTLILLLILFYTHNDWKVTKALK